MIAVAMIAAGLALAIRPSELGASLLFTALILVLLIATVLVFSRKTKALKGFVIFSVGYLVISGFYYPTFPEPFWIQLVNEAHISAYHPIETDRETYEFGQIGTGRHVRSYFRNNYFFLLDKDDPFYQTCLILVCPIFGSLGAILSTYLSRTETQN